MNVDLILFELIVLLLGVIVAMMAWMGNRLFKRLDKLIDEMHDHHTRLSLIEVVKES